MDRRQHAGRVVAAVPPPPPAVVVPCPPNAQPRPIQCVKTTSDMRWPRAPSTLAPPPPHKPHCSAPTLVEVGRMEQQVREGRTVVSGEGRRRPRAWQPAAAAGVSATCRMSAITAARKASGRVMRCCCRCCPFRLLGCYGGRQQAVHSAALRHCHVCRVTYRHPRIMDVDRSQYVS